MDGNNVTYTYHPGGRISDIYDGTGHRKLGYDALGNLVHEDRYIAIPNSANVLAFHTGYTYDSWGRMRTLLYPDGEQVTYTYRWGGDLFSVHGTKGADSCRYIDSIAYNAYGQRSYIHYGNGTHAQYSYDALHRLAQLKSYDSLGNKMQEIEYSFDQAGNITDINNTAGTIGPLGGNYANRYRYDALHRLATADDSLGFIQKYHITPAGRPATTQQHLFGDEAMKYYAYSRYHQPHAPRRIYVESIRPELHDLRWDQAGNLGQVSTRDEHSGDVRSRFLYWTEDNRLHTVVDDRYHSYYAYDHAGERTLKIAGPCEALDLNAWLIHSHSKLQDYTIYPSPYLVVTDHGYTKHYYAGAERLAARQGGGFGERVLSEQQHDDITVRQANHLFHQILKSIWMPRPLAAPEIHREKHLEDAVYSRMADHIHVPEILEAHADIWNSNFLQAMRDLVADAPEPDVYFYHSDHLGSASWITDGAGIPVQHLLYLPYGEPFVNQRVSGYNERFTFTGKERDEETGYSYFGARYMDHELMTMWLSVDPMADKYPSISPYAYCAWNPIRLIDPDGNEAVQNDDEWKYNTTTNKLTWLNDNGESEHQTVLLTSGTGDREVLNTMVSYNGQIEDMFDFSVISDQWDGIVDGGTGIVGGTMAFIGGLALSVITEGAAMPVAVPIALAGGAQVGFGIKSIAEACGRSSPQSRHERITSIFKTLASDASISIASTITKRTTFEKVVLTTSKLTKSLSGYATIAMDGIWIAIKGWNITHPTMKGYPRNATVTHRNSYSCRNGMVPH